MCYPESLKARAVCFIALVTHKMEQKSYKIDVNEIFNFLSRRVMPFLMTNKKVENQK